MTELDLKNLETNHKMGLSGIKSAYPIKSILSSYPFCISLLISTILAIFLYQNKDLYLLLSNTVDLVISIFPNILGFNLGGYALIIGFGNTNLLESMTQKDDEDNSTIFQQINGIFAFSILLQSLTFITGFIVRFLFSLNVTSNITTSNNTNFCTIIFLLFFALWSLTMIPFLVVNVFTFGQMHHFFLSISRLKEKKNKK